jgi:hypothetical protein
MLLCRPALNLARYRSLIPSPAPDRVLTLNPVPYRMLDPALHRMTQG